MPYGTWLLLIMLAVHGASGCQTNTGGTCFIFACYAWRGPTRCMEGKCLCPQDYCSVDGSCKSAQPMIAAGPAPAPHPATWLKSQQQPAKATSVQYEDHRVQNKLHSEE